MSVDPTYQNQIEDIKVETEKLPDNEMKKVYKTQKDYLEQLQSILGKIFVDYDTENGMLKLTKQQESKLTTEMKTLLKEMGIVLAQSEVEVVASVLGLVYTTTYYKNAWVLDQGIKASLKFDILKEEVIKKAVETKFKKELFSERIWKNKASMIDMLQSSLIGAFKGQISIDKIGREIRKTFNTTAYESKRLVVTETARIQTQATDDIAKSTGIKKQMYSATLDGKTNPKDASYDGKVYDIDDPKKPILPLHPNCRCCYINVPFKNWKPSKRKDNITGELIDHINYEDWVKNKGIKN